jgi:hypothetical protein
LRAPPNRRQYSSWSVATARLKARNSVLRPLLTTGDRQRRARVRPPITFRSTPPGEAAIYTQHFYELSLLRKILLRMRSWQNYVFFETL